MKLVCLLVVIMSPLLATAMTDAFIGIHKTEREGVGFSGDDTTLNRNTPGSDAIIQALIKKAKELNDIGCVLEHNCPQEKCGPFELTCCCVNGVCVVDNIASGAKDRLERELSREPTDNDYMEDAAKRWAAERNDFLKENRDCVANNVCKASDGNIIAPYRDGEGDPADRSLSKRKNGEYGHWVLMVSEKAKFVGCDVCSSNHNTRCVYMEGTVPNSKRNPPTQIFPVDKFKDSEFGKSAKNL